MRRFAGAGGLLSYFTRHRTAANLLLLLLIVAGLFAAPRMRAQFFPDVVSDEITVSIAWPGAGADAVDTGIVAVLEPALLAVEGVTESSSRAGEGSAVISLEFEPGWDMGRASDDVETALDEANDLPEAAEDPTIRRGGWRDRVTDVVITGPVSVGQLGRIADEFTTRLFQEGVTRTTTRGIAAPRVLVEVPSMALVQYDLTLAQIAQAIGAETDANPAGDVGGTARVRVGVEKRGAEEVAGIVLRAQSDGSALTVGDVARVVEEGPDRERAYFVGENPAVSVRVDRTEAGDALEIQATVEEVADAMRASLPEGVEIDLIRGRAEYISGRLTILLDNGLLGLTLVVGLLFLFLNARTALWVAAGIPVAMLAAIAMMYAAGLTINMISLFALIITLGIVVDDAIVVGEHADFRARVLGEGPVEAAENAARRMFAPVFSSTLTTVIAFFGLVVIGGTFGRLISDIPFTVIAVLAASLVECFLILPNHLSHTVGAGLRWYDLPSRTVNRGFGVVRDRLFRPLIRLVIWARYPVLAGAVGLLSLQAVLFISGEVQWRFFNAPERGSVTGNFAMSAGATRADTLEQVRLIQETLDRLGAEYEEEFGRSPVDYAIAEVGGTAGPGLSGTENTEPDLLGAISVELIDPDLRPYSSFEFVARLQDEVVRHPLLEELSFRGWRSGPGGDALDVQIADAPVATLKEAAEALKTRLARFPEVSALEDTLAYDKRELILELTPRGEALGFTIDGIGQRLRDRLSGIEAATYPVGNRSGEIRVELPEDEMTADFLDRVVLATPGGGFAALPDLVRVTDREGFSTIRRENGIRLVSVTGDLSEDDPARATEITETLRATILPALEQEFGVTTRLAGLSEDEDAFLADALLGLVLCLIGIYLCLAWIFASWTRPVVVMAVIPFGLVGAVWGHYVWEVPLSMFSIVGLIGMTGIVINDSIVLVTTIDEYAERRGLIPAIVDATCDRLRPVLLTTLTTVLGLTPLLYESSSQAQFLKPTIITLVYGLGFGMALVLLLVPAMTAMQLDAGRSLRALRRALRIRRGGVRAVVTGGAVAAALWFAATVGAWAVTGAPLLPLGGGIASFAAFAAGVAGIAVLAVAVAAALPRPRSRRA
ncbi:efflux RND transporter permease subunit [Palleronia sediminis]|uniref:Efflux RND transporter permease subunit n=1 Tax=Palleronia sediminis TaxID=2547833 RepID=A0A4R6AGL5_9RHOB|nr:efflux RND transporter permease subunit [Palleronia sediminis]TDL81598.1 efflux RND transporter permease subunit [Palleronia sediminis]